MAPGAGLALHGSILPSQSYRPNKNRSNPIKNRFGPQWEAIQPLDAYPLSLLEPFLLKLVGPFPFKYSGLHVVFFYKKKASESEM